MIELEKIHLVRMLQMPGGHSEIMMRGEKNGTITDLHLNCDRSVVEVVRKIGGDVHKRMVPLSNIQSMEEYHGGKSTKASQAGAGKRSELEPGKATSGGRGRPKKKG
tara:strand:- start:15 stop:335 length:321 start_codon:yes stop_codon:yes gene_type:complete